MIKVTEDSKGKKVLAEAFIQKGTVVCNFTGPVIDYTATLKLGDKESFAFQIDFDTYIYLDAPARFFNHSCEPNCGVTAERQLISLVDIHKDEELRWDYSTSMLEHHWTMKCKCGSTVCRGIIRDFPTLTPSLKEKYIGLGIVQKFILEAI